MTGDQGVDSVFAPERFFPLAASRLHPRPPEATAGVLGDHALNPDLAVTDIAYRDAAVLIPVVARAPTVSVLLTLRTPHLAAHAGQIAFPGGKIDPDDAGPAEAARREASEEIGLDPRLTETVGFLPPYLSRTGYRIVPVVARVDPAHSLTVNADEVEQVFEVPLSFLMTPANHRRGTRVFRGRPRYFYEMPFEGHYIWGVTAGIIRGLYEQVFG